MADRVLRTIREDPRQTAAGWVVSLGTTVAMGSMSYIALKTGEITISGRGGSNSLRGIAAALVGFILLAAALLPLLNLAKGTRIARGVAVAAFMVWMGVLVIYFAQRWGVAL
jgi:hypothetical protein